MSQSKRESCGDWGTESESDADFVDRPTNSQLPEPPSPIYNPEKVLPHHPLHLYPFHTKALLRLLDRTYKSFAPTLILAWLYFLLSNIYTDHSPSNLSTSLAITALYLLTRFAKVLEHVFYRRLPAKLRNYSKRHKTNTLHRLRQSNRYPQLPSKRENRRFCMLGPTQW